MSADRLVEVTDVNLGLLATRPEANLSEQQIDSMEEMFSRLYLASEKPFKKIPKVSVRRCSSSASHADKKYFGMGRHYGSKVLRSIGKSKQIRK